MKNFKTISLLAAAFIASTAAHSQNSVWLPAPGSGTVALNYLSQDADRFYIGGNLMSLPFGTIKLNTTTLSGQYSLADGIAVDARLPYARRTSGIGSDSGLADTRLGVTWRFVDEFERRNAPSVAVRLGAIFAGNYETERPDSIGDGASGYELSVLVGRYITPSFSVRGELGFRDRNKGVPNETFVSVGADWRVIPALVASVGYSNTRASGNLDIGGPGFSPARFQQVAEKRGVANVGLSYAISPRFSINGNVGKVTSGRNTSKSDIYSIGVAFDL
jgi:hypothetical protein